MLLYKTRIIDLKSGYIAAYKPNLRSNGVLGSVGINHTVKLINILLEAIHIMSRIVGLTRKR